MHACMQQGEQGHEGGWGHRIGVCRAHSDEAKCRGVGGGGALDAVDNEEAAGGAGERASVDEVIQQLAGGPHRLEQSRPHRRVRLARHAHHYVPELRGRGQLFTIAFVCRQEQATTSKNRSYKK